jgi:acyl carrier protein
MERVRSFISREFLVEFTNEVNEETDLFERELIDSFGFVELVTFLDAEFGVKLTDEDMAAPEMGTLAGIVRLVTARSGAGT